MDDRKKFLICDIGGVGCALPLDSVAEVMRPLPVNRLERAPAGVWGVALIRGQGVPVLDLSETLQKRAGTIGRFVSLRIGERLCALAVNTVVGIESIANAQWQDLPPLFKDVDATRALSVLDRDLVLLLETARLIPLVQSIPPEHA